MSVVEQRIPEALPQYGLLRLGNRDAVLMAVVLAVLPNILFACLAPWFLLRRMISPVIYVVAGMIAVWLPVPIGFLVFALAASADAFFIVAYLFDMPVETTLQAIRYAGEIKIQASALYIGAGAYFVILICLLTYLTRRNRAALRRASPILATMIAVGISFADFNLNGYKPVSRPEFESAMGQNHLTADTIVARNHNLLLVIVEGMGAFANPQERALLSGRLNDAAKDRFILRSGTSRYYGSTTGAEARELCGAWGTYVNFLRGEINGCLPQQLADRGYRTVSYHASGSDLFSRKNWYPHVGIQETNFYEDIERQRPGEIGKNCGSVFLGMCDSDLGDIIRRDLLKADGRAGLYYWLTLNSHIPYQPMEDNRFGCESAAPAIPALVPCQLAEIWSEVFDKVAAIAGDPDLPPTDILVVGDHNTPLWSRQAYGHFLPDKVDWYYLEDQRSRDRTVDNVESLGLRASLTLPFLGGREE
ncbi:MAG: hypothetical protein M9944_20395 [Rhizobiaceae bacterium]|nr:hypothetical protein [Rhizobiaceae bacterium]